MKDTLIIEGLKSGKEAAYRNLYENHYKVLCIVAHEYVHDSATAEMIVSDVILAIWTNRENLELQHSLRSYLVRAVRNRSLTYLNQQTRQVSLEHYTERFREEPEKDGYPLTDLIEKELDIQIKQSIDSMPTLTRRIFCMSRYDNLKYEEIARELHISVDVVKYHIKSALSHLRKDLKDYLFLLILLFFLRG